VEVRVIYLDEDVSALVFPDYRMVVLILLQNVYLLGTSLARPVIARGMIAVAEKEGCE
jgi:argininosuccinate synthase